MTKCAVHSMPFVFLPLTNSTKILVTSMMSSSGICSKITPENIVGIVCKSSISVDVSFLWQKLKFMQLIVIVLLQTGQLNCFFDVRKQIQKKSFICVRLLRLGQSRPQSSDLTSVILFCVHTQHHLLVLIFTKAPFLFLPIKSVHVNILLYFILKRCVMFCKG